MKKYTIIALIILVVGFAVFLIARPSAPNPRTALAQCLTEKGAVFYGAYWCPHCNNQKLVFGRSAVKQLNYVECALYPTEVSAVKKQALRDFASGTYTGGYLPQLQAAQAANELDQWEPSQTEACASAGVESYPTWKFADGSQQSGEVSLADLAAKTSCEYVD